MLEVVKRQTAEPTSIGTSIHRDPADPTHFGYMRSGAIAGTLKRFKGSGIIDACVKRVWIECSTGLVR